MKISQLLENEEPLIITLINQLRAKGKRIVRLQRHGAALRIVELRALNADSTSWLIVLINRSGDLSYLHLSTTELDTEWELVPGKTKNTWVFQRAKRVDEGLGDNLMTYIDFAEEHASDEVRQKIDPLAAYLVKHGFTFSEPKKEVGTGGFPRFVHRTPTCQVVVILAPLVNEGDGHIMLTRVYLNQPFGSRHNLTKVIKIGSLTKDGALSAVVDAVEKLLEPVA